MTILSIKDFSGLSPSCKCRKCGRKMWFPTEETLSWSCINCGNIVYLTYGTFKQQIDIIMASCKRDEFIHSEDREKVVPKKEERLKKLKFSAEMEKRETKL